MDPLRPDDYDSLWEHVVLEYLHAYAHVHEINYWRDISGRELDFVIRRNRDEADAIECKWDYRQFDISSLKAFRALYPGGKNYLICPNAGPGFEKKIASVDLQVLNPQQLLNNQ